MLSGNKNAGLYRNNNGTFVYYNLGYTSSTGAAWGDFDYDGNLDALIGGNPPRLLHNTGDCNFAQPPQQMSGITQITATPAFVGTVHELNTFSIIITITLPL